MKRQFTFIAACAMLWACSGPKTETPESDGSAKPAPVEFSEQRFVDAAQANLKNLAEGNVSAFADGIADDAVFYWNNGDSLLGKQAIINYWTERRGKAIDTITYKREAWLGVKANEPPPHLAKANYVFNWADFYITYANGKMLKMNIHHVYQFDDAGKIKVLVQYVDRAPILAATAVKPKK